MEWRTAVAGTLMAAMTAGNASAQSTHLLKATGDGMLLGSVDSGVLSFKGIPFASPPVGSLRWRAPQPVKKWKGRRDATKFGPDCLQQPFPPDDAPLRTKSAEDCLYLNIWTPEAPQRNARLPVIVWIYGGGFVNGGTSPAIYDGSAFARDGLVYVSFNYRLGRFGFFGFPEISRQNADGGRLGNYAVMDMIAALKWVKANIAAFGGDPDQVTIFGESAGGAAVNFLLTSPEARGLFQRAIVQSGGGREGPFPMRRLNQDQPHAPSSETLGVNFARKNGIDGTGAEALAALRRLAAEKLVDGLMIGVNQSDTYGGPMVDGKAIVEHPERAFAAGRAMAVPVMTGATSADIGSLPGATKDELFAAFGPHAAVARAVFDPQGNRDLERIRSEAGMSRVMLEPARFQAGTWASQGRPSWHYRFSYTATPRRAGSPHGAPHATEIPFIMDTVSARYPGETTAQDQSVAKLMHAYWANFARSGDPNGAGLPQWPGYALAEDIILDFEPDGDAVAKPDPLRAWLDVTAEVADAR
jgi:para-nitrobenzyl esterase